MFFLIKFYIFKINSKFFFNLNVFIFFFNLKKNINNVFIKPLYLSQKILIAKKNLFFFNIFNKKLDFSKKLVDFKKLYKIGFNFDDFDDCYLSIIKINKYKKYTFNSNKIKRRKRRKNKFYRSMYLLFKHDGARHVGNLFKKMKKVNFHSNLKN